jgi:hypothetical protein
MQQDKAGMQSAQPGGANMHAPAQLPAFAAHHIWLQLHAFKPGCVVYAHHTA